jgi:hypothetical protein
LFLCRFPKGEIPAGSSPKSVRFAVMFCFQFGSSCCDVFDCDIRIASRGLVNDENVL